MVKFNRKKPNKGTFVAPEKDLKDVISNTTAETESDTDDLQPLSFIALFRYSTVQERLLLTLAICCAIITGCIAPANTLIFARLTDAMVTYARDIYDPDSTPPDFDFQYEINYFAIGNLILGSVQLVFTYLATMIANRTAHSQIFHIRKLFIQSALNQDVAYYDVKESGSFASRMTDDLLKLEAGIGENVTTCCHFWMSFLSCIILALYRGWKMALVCLCSFPITLISVGAVGIMSSKLAKEESTAYAIAGSIAEEVLSGIRTVMAFGGQQKESIRFSENLIHAKKINIKRGMFTGLGFGILWFCIYGTYALSFWYGVTLFLDEGYSVDTMVAVFFGVLMGSMNFGISMPLIEIFGLAKGAGAKVYSVIENKPIIDPLADNGVRPTATCQGNITFKNVHFNYPSRPDVNVLQGINLNIKHGQTVAIVGSSGCGKSTCIQLVQRFYDPLEGEILLDDNNLRDLSVNWLRENIGVVGQEPVLFNTSIYDNIRYGRHGATKEDIERAAKQANAHDFIKLLPKGYDTLVGERGTQLSGGQKQRIAIARALVRNPKVLLLDEATSALDNTSERKVQIALDKASEGRTTIIVAHRLSTIHGADLIVVLNEGQVTEQGTHTELINLRGHYFNLVTAQLSTPDKEKEFNFQRKRSSKISLQSLDEDKELKNHDFLSDEVDNEVDVKPLPILKIVKLNGPEWKLLIVASLGALVVGGAMPVFSLLFGNIMGVLALVDPVEVRRETDFYCILFVVLGLIIGSSTFFMIFLYGLAGEKMTMRLRSMMFEAILRQEVGWFDDKANSTGALCARLSGDAGAVQGATGQRIGTMVQSVATLLVAIVLALIYQWKLGLVSLCFAPLMLFFTYLDRTVSMSESFGSTKAMQKSTRIAVDVLSNIRTVIALGREKQFCEEFAEALTPAMKKAKINTHYRGLVYGFARGLMFFAMSGSIYYGGYLILNEGVSFEDILKVTQVLMMSTGSVANALAFTPNLQKGIISASRIVALINRAPQVVDAPNALGPFDSNGYVNYENVTFSYPTRAYVQVLKGLNLAIEQGKTIALVGSSGCGKSTCVQLLERFYDTDDGRVLMDNVHIKELKMSELRKNIGIVSQEPTLFDRTIGENIAYGANDRLVTEQEIIDVARQANIHNFVASLPLGYDTKLGLKGAQLSGGQKQRVAIARALLRNPRVLLLDEATSALDTESEKVVQEALDKARLGRTCITIAHRLSTIRDADMICVFNDGVIAESGTHQELLELKGLYFKLQMQHS